MIMDKQKTQRNRISIEVQLEIVQAIQKGASISSIATERIMPISTVSGIWARRHKLFARLQENKIDSSRARIRESNFPELEKAMMIWLKQISSSASSVPINGPIIKCQAEKFACFLKIKDFRCSTGWLDGFRSRNKISTSRYPAKQPAWTPKWSAIGRTKYCPC